MTTAFDAFFNETAERYQVPAWLLEAIARTESSLQPNVQRFEPKLQEFSFGLMGMTLSTARRVGFTGSGEDLKDPETGIDVGGRYARAIIDSQAGLVPESFYSEWNSGSPTKWLTSTEVAAHVKTFLGNVAKALANVSSDQGVGVLVAIALLAVWWMRR